MTKRIYFSLFILGILVLLPVTSMQSSPGYMDADYYFAGGVRLAEGNGFSELVLWNYLDDPDGVPHPSHGYWMPLASLIAASGMILAKMNSFYAAKVGFLIIAGLLPPVTAALAYSIHAHKEKAIFSGLLAAFPIFYMAYLGTTDTFAVYILLGVVWFILLGLLNKYRQFEGVSYYRYILYSVALGLCSGLMHLARVDGILWFLLGLLSIVMVGYRNERPIIFARRYAMPVFVFILGYFLVMGPWMIRNMTVFGTPLAPGGIRAIWLTEYNDLFTYPAEIITFQRWWSTGLEEIVRSIYVAFSQNLQTLLFVQGLIVLAPLIVLGMWHLRNDIRIKVGFLAWMTTFVIMSFVFIQVGWRGGYFHSGAALQGLFWALIPVGLEAFVQWGVRVRDWDTHNATKVFRGGIVIMVIILTIFIAWRRVIGSGLIDPVWNQSSQLYERLENELLALGASENDIVLINNAPGYYATNNRPAISIPNGDINNSLEVAHRYGGRYLLLEKDHPQGLADLYQNPTDLSGLDYLLTFESAHIFFIEAK